MASKVIHAFYKCDDDVRNACCKKGKSGRAIHIEEGLLSLFQYMVWTKLMGSCAQDCKLTSFWYGCVGLAVNPIVMMNYIMSRIGHRSIGGKASFKLFEKHAPLFGRSIV